MSPEEKTHFFDKPENFKRFLRGFYAICVILLCIDFFYHRHVIHSWEGLFGFYAFYGFIACWLLVEAAKVLRWLAMRAPEYYDED